MLKKISMLIPLLLLSCASPYESASNSDNLRVEYRNNSTVRQMKGESLHQIPQSYSESVRVGTKPFNEAVFSFLESKKKIFNIVRPKNEFVIYDIKEDKIGFISISLQQIYNGIPFWGKQIKIHINKNNAIYLVNGDYVPTQIAFESSFDLSEEDASKKAVLAVSDSTGQWKIDKIDKYYFVLSDGIPRPSYAIKVVRGLLGNMIIFIDAINGYELHRISNIHKP